MTEQTETCRRYRLEPELLHGFISVMSTL